MIFTAENGILRGRCNNECIQIQAWGTNALRVRTTLNPNFSGSDQGLLPASGTGTITIKDNWAEITNGRTSARITITDRVNRLSFYRDGEEILQEFFNPYAPALQFYPRDYRPLGGRDYALQVRFAGHPGEKIFGMGQYQQPELDVKGYVMELAPKNAQVTIPFYISNLGYGFLWNNPAAGQVSFGKNYTQWESHRSEEIDYWITTGDTPRDLVRNFTEVTGRAPEYPDDLLGLWQCRLRYRTQEEVLEVAREYHRRGLPLDLIVVDFYHWTWMGDWSFDPRYWPDPAEMVRELKSYGTRCMVSVWPTVQKESVNYKTFWERGLLVTPTFGEPGGIFGSPFYDATNPEAREQIWKACKENYYDLGVDMYWLDCAEPEFIPPDFSHYQYHVGSAEKNAGLYPLLHAKAFYDGMKEAGMKAPVNLLRAAWVGSQRYGAAVWSGDIISSFETFRAQVCAGVNIGLAGIPWWTTDTAGFMGNVEDPTYNELLIRWFQFSTFSPILRLHGCLGPSRKVPDPVYGTADDQQPHELWSHGEVVYEILKKYLQLRLELKPYLHELLEEASLNGAPLLRAMFFEFPEDPHCWKLSDQYMLGSRYLVAPILEFGSRSRQVYLPAGNWKNLHTGEMVSGGTTITADAPLDVIPVFEKMVLC